MSYTDLEPLKQQLQLHFTSLSYNSLPFGVGIEGCTSDKKVVSTPFGTRSKQGQGVDKADPPCYSNLLSTVSGVQNWPWLFCSFKIGLAASYRQNLVQWGKCGAESNKNST